jgi:hypothetical protein
VAAHSEPSGPARRSCAGKRAFALLAAAAVSSALGLASGVPALGTRTVTIASHLTLHGSGLTFSGAVTAANPACKRSRKVTLYRTPSQVLGSVATASSGHWKITVPGSAGITLGHFYAKLKARSEGTAGTIYVCKPARSGTIAYKP